MRLDQDHPGLCKGAAEETISPRSIAEPKAQSEDTTKVTTRVTTKVTTKVTSEHTTRSTSEVPRRYEKAPCKSPS
jgi:hypothetical protein